MRYKKGISLEQKKILEFESLHNKGHLIDPEEAVQVCLVTGKYRPFGRLLIPKSDRVKLGVLSKLGLKYKVIRKSKIGPFNTVFYTGMKLEHNLRQYRDKELSSCVYPQTLKGRLGTVPDWAYYIGQVVENKVRDYSNEDVSVGIRKKAKEYCKFIKENFPKLHLSIKHYIKETYN